MMIIVMMMMMMMILGEVVDEFRQESKLKRIKEGDEVEVTLQDRLMFVRQVVIMSPVSPLYLYTLQVDNGDLCWKIYKMWKRRGRAVGLDTLMVRQVLSCLLLLLYHGVQSGLLTPNERDRVESKAWKYKEKLPDKLVEKENVLKTATGRGLLLITISIIRHR